MDEKLKCNICPYIAPRIERLKHHIQVTHQGLRVACKLCDHTSTETSNLNKHVQMVHNGVKYPCQYCGKVYVYRYRLKEHIENKHMNKERQVYSCTECTNEYLSKKAFSDHMKTHQEGISHACEKCDFKTKNAHTLSYHVKNRHKQIPLFGCKICVYKGRRRPFLVHMDSKHGSERFKCDICSYVSTRAEYLKAHIERVHGTFVFSCGLCDYKCNARATLQSHKSNIHSNVSYPCGQCDFVLPTKSKLTEHITTKHNMIKYKCDRCEKTYTVKRFLRIHMLNKHDGIVWPCTICPYKAAGPHILSEHTKHLHSTCMMKKHKCAQCGEKFAKKFYLTMHIRLHTGEKPNRCKICSKEFRQSIPRKHRLGQCMKIDSFILKCKGILVDCKECGKTTTSRNMKRHIENIHKTKEVSLKCVLNFKLKYEKPENSPSNKQQLYKDCEKCGKSLKSKSMPRHIRDVHNGMVMKTEENEKLPDKPRSFLIEESINSLLKI